MPTGHWASEAVKFLSEKKIIEGYSDGSLKPDKPINRAEFTKLVIAVYDALGIEISSDKSVDFTDVDESMWYSEYVKKAAAAGLIRGNNSLFSPNDNITREDTAVILYRMVESLIEKVAPKEFTDEENISPYALEAVIELSGAGVINGMGNGEFMPKASLTRAQASVLIFGICEILEGGK